MDFGSTGHIAKQEEEEGEEEEEEEEEEEDELSEFRMYIHCRIGKLRVI